MSFEKISNIAKFLLTRTLVVYLLLAAVVFSMVDLQKLVGHARPTTLSRLRPDYKYLGDLADGRVAFDKKSTEDFRIYFENVNLVMSERADADALLGYCYYSLGQSGKAKKAFQRSADLAPVFFWDYYDLGLMAFKAKDYTEASRLLSEAVTKSPEISLKFMASSKVYQPLFLDAGYSPERLFINLKQGYGQAFELLVTSYFSSGHYPEALRICEMALNSGMVANKAFFLYYAGQVMVERRDYANAAKFFEDCLREDPDHTEALALMAVLFKQLGKEELATVFFAKAKEVSARRPTALPSLDTYYIRGF